ncbi:hypothetical protein DMUE_4695 [Dictyocoela muelleri]|nr:hypothetical protein DMUE_4695 [Dictyocoela muelleri]
MSSVKNIAADELTRKISVNLLYDKGSCFNFSKTLLYPPAFNIFMSRFHITHEYPGFVSTYFPQKNQIKIDKHLRKSINNLIKTCYYCQIYKNNYRIYGDLKGQIHTSEPLKHISTDLYGPINADQYEHNIHPDKFFIITSTDRFSRYTKIRFITELLK